jgi:trimethylamine--corrinoid protein Co-methyltransferase
LSRSDPPPSAQDPGAPTFRVLSDGQRRRIHEAAVAVLEDPGIRITTEAGRGVLADAGAVPSDGGVVRIPARLVTDALAAAPQRFLLYDREGRERIRLGEGRPYFGTGVTALAYEDPETGVVDDVTLDDMAALARLTDALPSLDFIATPGVVRAGPDLPQRIVNQREFLAMLTGTTKPIMPLVADATALGDIAEMAAIVAGGEDALRARPFVVPYLNSVTPLVFDPTTLDKLLLAVDRGLPVACQAAPTLGGTAPVTPAGTAVLCAAETLAALVIAQARRPGAPFISGSMPMAMDMRTGDVTGGGAPGLLAYLAGAEMARHWGLPQVGSAGAVDAKLSDEQSARQAALEITSSALAGVDLAFDVGSLEMGLAVSAIQIVLADEAIEVARGLLRGVPTDDEALAVDVIREVGVGGHFLASRHTARHQRDLWMPTLTSWGSRSAWEAAGGGSLRDRARARAIELIEGHRPPDLPANVLDALEAVVERRRIAGAGTDRGS